MNKNITTAVSAKSNPRIESIKKLEATLGHKGVTYTSLGYRATQMATNDGLSYTRGSGDWHTTIKRKQLINMARQFDRDNLIYNAIVNRLVDNILGKTGFTLQAKISGGIGSGLTKTKAKKLNEKIEKELWPRFAENPEAREMYNFEELQAVVLRDVINAGDMGAIASPSADFIQLIEAERIEHDYGLNVPANKTISEGIEVDSSGTPKAYYIGKPNDSGEVPATEPRRVSANNFIHVHGLAKRITQSRGVPWLSSIFPMVHRLNDILDANAVAWQLISRYAVSITLSEADLQAETNSDTDSDAATPAGSGELTDRIIETPYGIMFWGEPGEEIKGIAHDLPGANFPESVKTFLRLMGMQVGFPLEIMFLDFSQTNFTSFRGALQQAHIMIDRWQRVLIRQFNAKVYRWFIRRCISRGELPDIPGIDAHEWFTPPVPWADPNKETLALGKQLDRGLITFSEALKERNRDRESVIAALEEEVKDAVEAAKRVKEATGVDVDYRIFTGYEPPTPKDTSGGVAEDSQPEDPADYGEANE